MRSLKPFWQLHSKLPIVFLQKWSQPPLLSSHSSISVGSKKAESIRRINESKMRRTLCVHLCMFFHLAVKWIQQGNCSGHLWKCLYRCNHIPHCSQHTFLKGQGIVKTGKINNIRSSLCFSFYIIDLVKTSTFRKRYQIICVFLNVWAWLSSLVTQW